MGGICFDGKTNSKQTWKKRAQPENVQQRYDKWDSKTRTATKFGAEPGIAPISQTAANLVGVAQLGLDIFESGISIVEGTPSSLVSAAAILLATTDPSKISGAAALLIGMFAGIPADMIEDIPGWADVGLNMVGDILGGTSYIDLPNNELVIGQDTFMTLVEQSIDTALPQWADIPTNAAATAYDALKLFAIIPDFMEIRIPLDINGGMPIITEAYVVVYPDALK